MTRHRRKTLLAALMLAAAIPVSPQAFAQAVAETEVKPLGTQSLTDVLRYTYENNPTILAERARLLATQENLPQADANWKPSASASGDVTSTKIEGAGNPDGSTSESIGVDVTQPLYRGGRTVSQTASVKNAIMAQRAFLISTEQNILLQAVIAYTNVLRDQKLLDLAVNNKDVISKQLDASRARFEVGDVTRTDVSQSEARLAEAESFRVDALGDLRVSLAVFQQITGLPPETLTLGAIDVPIPPTLDEAVAMAEDFNPDVLTADFLHKSSREDIDTVFGELLPTLGLFGSWDYTKDPAPGLLDDRTTSAIGISATIPLYEAGSVRSRVRQARNTAGQRLMEVHEARRQARQSAISNWEGLEAAKAEITSRVVQVDAARIARDGVRKEAELGTRTILDALDADQELLDAETALVIARRNEVVARFSLAAALGLMTPEILGFPELERDYNDHLREIRGKIFSTDTTYGQDIVDRAED